MKRKNLFSTIALMLAVLVVALNSCKKDEDPSPLSLVALVAGTIDLNGAVSPSDVPVNPTIVATFNVNVDPATATNANIIMEQDYDGMDIPLTISVSGKELTITPANNLGSGALYELNFGAGLESTDGLSLTALTRTFTTEGAFVPSGVIAHWPFENDANDAVSTFDPDGNGVVAITYAASRNADAGMAATFDGDVSIIEIPNGDELMNTDNFTLSFWVKTNSDGHVDANANPAGHFVIGLGAFFGFQFEINGSYDFCKMPVWFEYADGTGGTGGDLGWNGDGITKDNGGWAGTTFNDEEQDIPSLLKDKWAHVVYVYDAAEKTRSIYINGELRIQQDHDLWPEPNEIQQTVVGLKYGGTEPDVVNELAFGFVQSRAGTMWDAEPWGGYDITTSNHFKGQLDDVRIFHKALTATEISLMYDSEKP